MKDLLSILIILVLTGCSPEKNTQVSKALPPELSPHVQRFHDLYKGQWPNLQIVFAQDGFGVCEKRSTYRVVRINESAWAELNYLQREALVFHELGHCVLNRTHATGLTYMNEQVQSHEFYIKHHAELYAELFKDNF